MSKIKDGFLSSFSKWLRHRPLWMSWSGFGFLGVLSIVNVVLIDPLPFVDEATLVAGTLFFGKALLDRKKKNSGDS